MMVPLGEWAAWENVSTEAPQSLVCGCPAQNFRLTRRCLSPHPLSSLHASHLACSLFDWLTSSVLV